jgi:hypothetical protein
MNKVNSDEIITKTMLRYFVQPGGADPENPVYYSGVSSAYMNIESVSNPISGGISPINVQDPSRVGLYRKVGSQRDPADFATFTVQFMQKLNALPAHLVRLGECPTNFYEVAGLCQDLSDFLGGWSAYVKVMSDSAPTNATEGGGAFDSGEAVMDEVEYTAQGGVFNIGKLGIGEFGAVTVYSEVVDIVYGSQETCGNCGPANDGTRWIYALMKNTVASTGQAPSFSYSVDYGVTFTDLAITGSASTDVPVAAAIVGKYLVAVFDDGATGGYFISEINSITGIPGAFTKVITGFTTGKAPTDIYVASASSIWFSAKGGYIYQATNILSGVSVENAGAATTNQLNRIDGLGEVIVLVGASGTVVVSLNRGETFNTTTANPSGNSLNALSVNGQYLWWVGDASGGIFYTKTQGASWTTMAAVPATVTAIQDIVFVNKEVGYIVGTSAGPTAELYTTWNGGYSWTNSTPRILNFPTFDRVNRIAVPDSSNRNTNVNNVAWAGLGGNGTDGIILLGKSSSF